jgi:outer membrane protein
MSFAVRDVNECGHGTSGLTSSTDCKPLTKIPSLSAALLILATTIVPNLVLTNDAHATLDDPFMIRGRAIAVIPRDDASITPYGGYTDIDPKFTIEVDFTYFFTENIAVELIAASPEHHASWVGPLGEVQLGSVQLLPPTLTLQYHFREGKRFRPYVGAGINYTWFFDEEPASGLDVKYDDSFGFALQAGMDFELTDNVFLNFDVKHIFLDTDATINAGALGIINADVKVDPWIVGVGVGYRF